MCEKEGISGEDWDKNWRKVIHAGAQVIVFPVDYDDNNGSSRKILGIGEYLGEFIPPYCIDMEEKVSK